MKTKSVNAKTNQNVKGIVAHLIANASSFDIPIEKIVTSPYNPRKRFDEAQIDSLATNIDAVGLIQPILVRPCKDDDMYELIVGERRFRAMQKANKKVIPGLIRDVPDELARAIALSENINRVDLTPIEEAQAFQAALVPDSDIKALSVDYGVSETYIRNRIQLLKLIPDIAKLLTEKVISIGAALEITRYPDNIQENVYKAHLKENCTGTSWRPMKVKELAQKLAENYSQRLTDYKFDKSDCEKCQHNTALQELFVNTCSCRCQNRTCLEEKNTAYLISEATRLLINDTTLELGVCRLTDNAIVMQHLIDIGYEPVQVDWLKPYVTWDFYPSEPVKPKPDDFQSQVLYLQELDRYQLRLSQYQLQEQRLKEGTLKRYLIVEETRLSFILEDLCKKAEAERVVIEPEADQLREKDEAFRAKRDEDIIVAMRDFVAEQKVPTDPISPTEQRLCLYLLYRNLESEFEEKLNFRKELTVDRVKNLKTDQRIKLMRCFIFSQIFRDKKDYKEFWSYFREYCKQYYPEKLAEIEDVHEKKYQNKHQAIERRLAEIEAEEQAVAEAGRLLPEYEQSQLPPITKLIPQSVSVTVPQMESRTDIVEDAKVLVLLPQAVSPDQPEEIEQALKIEVNETAPEEQPGKDSEVAMIETEIITEAPQSEPEIIEVSAETVGNNRTETMPVPVPETTKKQGKGRKRLKSKSVA